MTLIFGINLCDRIYLSADTRLTNKKDGLIKVKDKVLKIVSFTPNIIGAFAGNANMAAFVSQKLLLKMDFRMNIREFRDNAQSIIAPIANEYWETTKDTKASIAIIFGGINRTARKKFNQKSVYDKIMEYTKLRPNHPQMNLRPALFNVMLGESRYPEPPDSHVFSVKITPPSGFSIEDANWGEYLAYGTNGITKNEINPITFGMVEFSHSTSDRKVNFDHDNMSIKMILTDVKETTKEEGISGAFVIALINETGTGIMGGGVYRVDLDTKQAEMLPSTFVDGRDVYIKESEDKEEIKLIPIERYKDFGSLEI